MIKKILGEAPFDFFCEDSCTITPGKQTTVKLVFENITEYDLPLKIKITLSNLVKLDKTDFSLIVPANGKTHERINFFACEDVKIISAKTLCDIKIIDGVLESESDYELVIDGEMAYKCADSFNDAFTKTGEVFYTDGGTFFANKEEYICLEIPLLEDKNVSLSSSCKEITVYLENNQIENINNITLKKGLNKLCVSLSDDGEFIILDSVSGEKIYLDTINPYCFLED